MKVAPRRAPLAVVMGFALMLVAGCMSIDPNHIAATYGSSSKPYQEFLEDPVTLTTIKTIAVFPFDNQAPQPGFDAEDFANKLANQLAAEGKVRVIYPREILARVDSDNRMNRRYNANLREKIALGLVRPEEVRADPDNPFSSAAMNGARPRTFYDPVRNRDEAVRLARQVKADAVIVGEVTDYDPYMRPKLAVTMRVIATGNTETAANAIAEMTQWGIPRMGAGGASSGTIYIRQEMFDSSIGSVGLDVSKYGRTHLIADHPYGTEVFVRSMGQYYEVVANKLAKSYIEARRKAVKEAEERAKTEARRQKRDQDAAVRRLMAMMERDSRIPDHETDARGDAYFDQAFAEKNAVIAANNGDRRIQSWRPDGGRTIRPATVAERRSRDSRIPENERGRGLDGYSTMVDAGFPDADTMMEMNMGDTRDRSWRPDYYNHANPAKSAPLYAPDQYVGGR
jgi:hypothetical protein